MADKYLNYTGLDYYHSRLETIFAEKSEIPTKLSELQNDGDGTQGSAYATEDYVDQNGGKIDSITINGNATTIDQNKNVDLAVATLTKSSDTYTIAQGQNSLAIEVDNTQGSEAVSVGGQSVALQSDIPTAVSDLTDDVGIQTASDVASAISTALANGNDPYQTESDVDGKISTAISSVYRYKGSVATYNDLPASDNVTGDVWDVRDTGINYAWNGTGWDALGTSVDTSTLWSSVSGQSNSLIAITTAEIDTIVGA